eukprot:GFUD01012069.1.p1 GENE.GFUD01012069.1~~GFUD01012069.1.p1  ORF type:complete len:257 (+),score=66.07 GFUD01012069.1:80-772(+)
MLQDTNLRTANDLDEKQKMLREDREKMSNSPHKSVEESQSKAVKDCKVSPAVIKMLATAKDKEVKHDAEWLGQEIGKVLENNKKDNTILKSLLEQNYSQYRLNMGPFIRVLTTKIMESVIDGIDSTEECKLNKGKLEIRKPVLMTYLSSNTKLGIEALFSLQYLMQRLNHPNKLLHEILEALYDYDIITEEAFLSWEMNDDLDKQEGKGLALKSCGLFFTWLREAEEEED